MLNKNFLTFYIIIASHVTTSNFRAISHVFGLNWQLTSHVTHKVYRWVHAWLSDHKAPLVAGQLSLIVNSPANIAQKLKRHSIDNEASNKFKSLKIISTLKVNGAKGSQKVLLWILDVILPSRNILLKSELCNSRLFYPFIPDLAPVHRRRLRSLISTWSHYSW